MTEPEDREPIKPENQDVPMAEDDPLAIVPEKPAADDPPPPLPRKRLRLNLPALRFPKVPAAAVVPSAAVLVVLFGIFLLYGPRWLSGTTIFRGVVQEQYYLLGQYAFDQLIEDEFSRGYFPLWNHLNALGTPLLGNMLSAALYPLKLFVYLRDTDGMRDFIIVLRLLIAALLAFILGRELKLSPGAAVLAAVSFALTGYFKQFVNENYLNADVLLPGMLLLALRLRRRGSRLDFSLLALLTFSVLQNGHPEAAFYCLLPTASVVATSGRRGLARAAARVGTAVLVGFGLSLPMLLPFLEYWGRGLHFHTPFSGFFHYPASELPALVSPWFFAPAAAGAPFYSPPAIGWPDTATGLPAYADTVVPWLCPALAAVPIFFAALAVSKPNMLRRTETALLVYSLFFLGVMYGLPGFRLIGFVPVFDFSGNFKHPLPTVALATALLSGRGLDLALDRRLTGMRVMTAAVAFFVFTLALGLAQRNPATVQHYLNLRSMAVMLAMLAAAVWTAISAMPHGRKQPQMPDWLRRVMASAVAVAAALFCLVMDGWHQPAREIDYLGRVQPETLQLLRDQAGLDRVYFSQEIFPPNLNLPLGLADLRVMDGVNDRRYVDVINRINGHSRAEGGRYWYREIGYLQPRPDRLNHPLLRLLNLRFAVMEGPLPWDRRQRSIHQEAEALAPTPGHIGRAALPLGEGTAPGFLLHPPARADLIPGDSSENWTDVRFHPAVSREAAPRQLDGVWFHATTSGDRLRLAYARYLHPRSFPLEADPGAVEFGIPGGEYLSLSALPAGSTDFDQAGFSDLRLGGKADFDPQPWEEATRQGNWVWRNPEALPRFFVARQAKPASDGATLVALAEGIIDPRQVVAVNDGGSVTPGEPGRRLAGEVREFSYASQRLEVEVEMWSPGWLVVSDLFFPGWRATVDGKPERVRRADYLLRALPLAAGNHRVTMTYQPWSFRLGLWAMLTTLLTLPGLGARVFSPQVENGHNQTTPDLARPSLSPGPPPLGTAHDGDDQDWP